MNGLKNKRKSFEYIGEVFTEENGLTPSMKISLYFCGLAFFNSCNCLNVKLCIHVFMNRLLSISFLNDE